MCMMETVNAYGWWFFLFSDRNPGLRRNFSADNTALTITNICKFCSDGRYDLMVVQCNASNVHGYAFASVYLNVLSE